MNLIDFTNIDNYSNDLKLILNKILYDSNANKDIINTFDFDNHHVNEFLEVSKLNVRNSLWQEVYDLVKNNYIGVYHFSKVINVGSIHKNGLLVNSINNYLNDIGPVLELINDDSSVIKDSIIKELNRKNELSNPKVCFFYPEVISDEFNFFSSFVGGEILSTILSQDSPNEYNRLKSIGTPIRVKFRIKISDINISHFDRLVLYIISQYCFLLYNITAKIGFDSFTNKNVPSENIVEIKLLN